MKTKLFFLSLTVLLITVTGFIANAQDVNNIYPVFDAYTTTNTTNGVSSISKTSALPRLADDVDGRLVLRFDLLIASTLYQVSDIESVKLEIVSVLEGGLTGTSRRLSDANIEIWEADNNWVASSSSLPVANPNPFALTKIAGPVYFPAMGVNTGLTDFQTAYETPIQFNVTDYIKNRLTNNPLDVFSLIALKKYIDTGVVINFTRMGSVSNPTEAYWPRLVFKMKTTGIARTEMKGLNISSNSKEVDIKMDNMIYGKVNCSILDLNGRILTSTSTNKDSQFLQIQIGTNSFPKGVYLVKVNSADRNYIQKIIVI